MSQSLFPNFAKQAFLVQASIFALLSLSFKSNISSFSYGTLDSFISFSQVATCEKEMKESRVPYEKLEMFDLNERLRSAKIEACTKKACLAKFGNNDCDTDT